MNRICAGRGAGHPALASGGKRRAEPWRTCRSDLLRSGRPRAAAFFLAGILVGASVGLASGAIPSTGSGVIYACYDNAGNLRVIDNETSTCPKNQKSLSWSQNGPQGAQGVQGNTGQQGVQGATGPKGDAGDPGGTSLASLDGSACDLPGGGASGVVTITVGGDGLIVLRCVTWCAAQTLPSGPHLSSTCDEATRTITTSCDTFWVDVNDDLGDGCERSYGQAAAELLLLHDVDITVPASCGSNPAVGCVGGVPVDPLPTVHATGTNVVAQEVVGASRFDSSALVVLRTASPIPLTAFGAQCGFSIDTHSVRGLMSRSASRSTSSRTPRHRAATGSSCQM